MHPDFDSNSAHLFERALEVMPGGNSRETVYFPPYPIYAARGEGAKLWDADNVCRLDFVNSFSSAIHGHCHPDIVKAVQDQVAKLVCVAAPTELEVELAEIIVDRIPSIEQLRFCNSGTEAVMLCIKAARAFKGRPKIAKVEGAYHGTFDAVEVSQNATPDKWGPDNAPSPVATAEGTTKGVMDDVVVLPLNDVETSLEILNRNKEQLSCVLLDPVPARMGYLPSTSAYLLAMRKWCSENDVVLIFDEVMTVRGGYNGMQGEYGIVPDLSAVGKIVGGGLPIGVIGGKKSIMKVFDVTQPGRSRVPHGGSFNAHPVSMAAGIACMKLLDHDAFDHLARLGEKTRQGLKEAFSIAGVAGHVNGHGSMIGYLFTDTEPQSFRDIVNAKISGKGPAIFFDHFINNGILPLGRGGMLLSTVMTDADIDQMLDVALAGLRKVREKVGGMHANV